MIVNDVSADNDELGVKVKVNINGSSSAPAAGTPTSRTGGSSGAESAQTECHVLIEFSSVQAVEVYEVIVKLYC